MVRRGRAPRIIPLGLLSLSLPPSRSGLRLLSAPQQLRVFLVKRRIRFIRAITVCVTDMSVLSLLWLDFKDFLILSKSAFKVTLLVCLL